MKKAVAYCRYSSDNQREESIEAQTRAIREFAERNNYSVVKIYADEAKSATSDNRPEFLKLIKDSKAGVFDCVIVHKLDRFSRDRYDSAFYKKELKKNGVRLISVLENLDDSPESIILESVLEGMAEYYSANLAREVMKGMKETAYQCKHTGGIAPLGYDVNPDKTYSINLHESQIVRDIFVMYREGKTYGEILDHLRLNQYKTKGGREFGKNSLNNILRNEKYSGTYVFNKIGQKERGKKHVYKKAEEDIIRVEGGMPQIVDKELWMDVQKMLNASSQSSKMAKASKEIYLLSGLIFCAKCGGAMVGNRRFSGRNKALYVTYECNTRKRTKECDMKAINRDYIEDVVINYIEKSILNEQSALELASTVYDKFMKSYNSIPADITKLSSELKTVQSQIDNIINAITSGMFHVSMKEKMDTLEAQKASLTIRLEEAKTQLENTFIPDIEIIKNALLLDSNIKNKPKDTQRVIIQKYIKKIVIFNGPTKEDNYIGIHSIVDTMYGGEGNRTPVRKPVYCGLYHHSHCFNIPSMNRPETGCSLQ